jgi:hypothetical protein
LHDSGFLIEIESGSLRLTGKNKGGQETWNTALTLQQQAVTDARGGGAEAVADPAALQWAGRITAAVYVAMPRVHIHLRLFGSMTLHFRILDDGPDIQSITAELKVSYPVLRAHLPFWVRSKLKEHDACGAPQVDESEEDMSTKLRWGSAAAAVTKPGAGDKPLTLFDSTRFKQRVQASWSDEAHDAPLLNVTGALTLTFPCAESHKSEAERKCKKWDKGRGLDSFPFQFNLSTSVKRVTHLNS